MIDAITNNRPLLKSFILDDVDIGESSMNLMVHSFALCSNLQHLTIKDMKFFLGKTELSSSIKQLATH